MNGFKNRLRWECYRGLKKMRRKRRGRKDWKGLSGGKETRMAGREEKKHDWLTEMQEGKEEHEEREEDGEKWTLLNAFSSSSLEHGRWEGLPHCI